MYNGIGLSTARGSGTNGYVQRNLSSLRPRERRQDNASIDDLKPFQMRKANQDILEHEKKREVEVKCLHLQEQLESEGMSEEDVEARVDAMRQELLQNLEHMKRDSKKLQEYQVHQMAEAKEKANERAKHALGISNDFVSGAAFDRDLQEKLKQERVQERERREEEKRQRMEEAESKRLEDAKQRAKEAKLRVKESGQHQDRVSIEYSRRNGRRPDSVDRSGYRSSRRREYLDEETVNRRGRSGPKGEGERRDYRRSSSRTSSNRRRRSPSSDISPRRRRRSVSSSSSEIGKFDRRGRGRRSTSRRSPSGSRSPWRHQKTARSRSSSRSSSRIRRKGRSPSSSRSPSPIRKKARSPSSSRSRSPDRKKARMSHSRHSPSPIRKGRAPSRGQTPSPKRIKVQSPPPRSRKQSRSRSSEKTPAAAPQRTDVREEAAPAPATPAADMFVHPSRRQPQMVTTPAATVVRPTNALQHRADRSPLCKERNSGDSSPVRKRRRSPSASPARDRRRSTSPLRRGRSRSRSYQSSCRSSRSSRSSSSSRS